MKDMILAVLYANIVADIGLVVFGVIGYHSVGTSWQIEAPKLSKMIAVMLGLTAALAGPIYLVIN